LWFLSRPLDTTASSVGADDGAGYAVFSGNESGPAGGTKQGLLHHMKTTRCDEILSRNQRFIPGGVISVNRTMDPNIVFARAKGQHLWDVEGSRYIDYHAAFSAHFLGHNDAHVSAAVRRVLDQDSSLFGAGTTELEGDLAEAICANVDAVETVQFLNSGSEATYQAIRLARAATRRDHVIVMQGGYNGWHNDVACNLMTPLSVVGSRRTADEYPVLPISAGMPKSHQALIHPVNFNDLVSVEHVCRKHEVAALITEPILQNVGVVQPLPGYMEGLRELADLHGFLLIFDEVKTGFRHSLGGFSEICGVVPDLAVYGKALANGYPIAALGGRAHLMDYFTHPDPGKRVLLAGTYNAHPVPTAAAVATIERLREADGSVYKHVERLGEMLEDGLNAATREQGMPAVIVRRGSAICPYFMDHEPRDWHDIAEHHDMQLDAALRQELIRHGVFVFPLAVKQWSISAAHQPADIEITIEAFRLSLAKVLGRGEPGRFGRGGKVRQVGYETGVKPLRASFRRRNTAERNTVEEACL
jgi:glutamate-1-semialdehyde 2,1-aminomutase